MNLCKNHEENWRVGVENRVTFHWGWIFRSHICFLDFQESFNIFWIIYFFPLNFFFWGHFDELWVNSSRFFIGGRFVHFAEILGNFFIRLIYVYVFENLDFSNCAFWGKFEHFGVNFRHFGHFLFFLFLTQGGKNGKSS